MIRRLGRRWLHRHAWSTASDPIACCICGRTAR